MTFFKRVSSSNLVYSSILTIVLTTVQLISDYKTYFSEMEQQFANIEHSHKNSLIKAAWDLDRDLIDLQLRGIMALPYISKVELTLTNSDSLVLRASESMKYPLLRSYDLLYPFGNTELALGKLHITVDKAIIYQRLLDSILYIIVSHAIRTFLVSIFILFVFYMLIIRRLNSFASYTHKIIIAGHADQANIKPPVDRYQDEFSEFFDAIEHMRNFLSEKIDQLADKKQELFIQATTDTLTGIHNRKSIIDCVDLLIDEMGTTDCILTSNPIT